MQVWVGFWQNKGQLLKNARLKMPFFSLNYSLISAEQVGELKIMREVHCCH